MCISLLLTLQQTDLLQRAMRHSSCASGFLSRKHSSYAASNAAHGVPSGSPADASADSSTATLQQPCGYEATASSRSASLRSASSLTSEEASRLHVAKPLVRSSDHSKNCRQAAVESALAFSKPTAACQQPQTSLFIPVVTKAKSVSEPLPTLFETSSEPAQDQVVRAQLSRAELCQGLQPQQQQRHNPSINLQAVPEPNSSLKSPLQSPFAGLASSCIQSSSGELQLTGSNSLNGALMTLASTSLVPTSRTCTTAISEVEVMKALPEAQELFAGWSDWRELGMVFVSCWTVPGLRRAARDTG